MLQLSEIWVYPIKSLGGIQLQESNITDRGLELDRRWMLIDSDNRFLSQREHPELALLQPEISNGVLRVTYKNQIDFIEFAARPTFLKGSLKIKVTVWDDTVLAYEENTEVSNWFSKILKNSVRLVYMPDESHRKLDSKYAVSSYDSNSFSDGFPFLIIGQASLNELNSRLKVPVSMNRFRPNFVFTNGEAFEEDTWSRFSIGDMSFIGVKPCSRCVMTTVDQDKGVFLGKEPLKTLAKFRNFNNEVYFGQNVIGLGLGTVSVGDAISVLSFNK
jgi:uncharacterized protein YcbX